MARFVKNREKKFGLAPGSLQFVGEVKTDAVRKRIIDYTKETLEESVFESPSELKKFREKESVTWINIDGLQDVEGAGHGRAVYPSPRRDIVIIC